MKEEVKQEVTVQSLIEKYEGLLNEAASVYEQLSLTEFLSDLKKLQTNQP